MQKVFDPPIYFRTAEQHEAHHLIHECAQDSYKQQLNRHNYKL